MLEKHDVLLVDDHPVVREFLADLINNQSDLAVSGEASSVQEALDLVSQKSPRIVIVDLSLPERSGLELIEEMSKSHPQVATLVLSMHEDKHYAERALRAGARGYVTKREASKEIIGAIKKVLRGDLALSERTKARVEGTLIEQRSKNIQLESLSDRELQVFRLLGQGLDTRRIALRLDLSIKTVQSYCARIKVKLELANVTELLHEALRFNERGAI